MRECCLFRWQRSLQKPIVFQTASQSHLYTYTRNKARQGEPILWWATVTSFRRTMETIFLHLERHPPGYNKGKHCINHKMPPHNFCRAGDWTQSFTHALPLSYSSDLYNAFYIKYSTTHCFTTYYWYSIYYWFIFCSVEGSYSD